jgi:CRISPR-associated endonuclease Csy4
MDHYLELRLMPDPEFKSTVLMNALFAKLHRALFDLNSTRIGISFPGVQTDPKHPGLGDRLRLHGTATDLRGLMALNWLTGMRDHTDLFGPAPVPETDNYRVVRRVQVKSSPERLRRRLARRKGITEAEACQAISQDKAERLDLPYVTITSRSTGQRFRLFIDHRPPGSTMVDGAFSYYGLSPTATVPWF